MRKLSEAFRSCCGLGIAESIQRYEATFTDPAAYTTSWTIAAPMTPASDPNAEIMEFACVEGNTDNLHYPTDVGGTTEAVPLDVPEEFRAPGR